MGEPDVRALTDEWQRRLRLQDWDIEVVVKRHWDIGDNISGYTRVALPKSHAWIEILDPLDFNPNWVGAEEARDVEVTVVHELLHVKFPDLSEADHEGRYEALYHPALHQLANVLVGLKRAAPMEDVA